MLASKRFQIGLIFLSALFVFIIFSSCKKENLLNTGGSVSFSQDTLTFDTVFTSKGSATRNILIYNNQDQPIKLSSVRLGQGGASPFTLNVDGEPGFAVKDVEIAPRDSIFVFASVNIDPNNDDNPFVIKDHLIATLNGNDFSVPLLAYGQNAVYIFDSVLTTQTWTANKPYVIINNALVDAGETLTILPGARIYNHYGSRLFVVGTLKALGTKSDSIIFQGDRLDRRYFDYDDIPGEWGGIYFTDSSTGNELRHVIIKNGGNSSTLGNAFVQPASIQVDGKKPGLTQLQLRLDKVTIQNSLGYGVLSFGGEIWATNCKMVYCGAPAFAGVQGGSYKLENCTFGGYSSLYLKHFDNPIVALTNFLELPASTILSDLQAEVTNCIIYGTLEQELLTGRLGNGLFNVQLRHSIIKAQPADLASGTDYDATVLFNADPEFEDAEKFDFHLKSTSAAINKGTVVNGITDDLDNKTRNAPWDLGCYEY